VANATSIDGSSAAGTSGLAARMAELANERGGRLVLAARDAQTIAGMLDNHGRPDTARFLRRSGDRGERIGHYLTEAGEAEVRRAAAIAGTVAAGLVVVRWIRAS